MRSVACPRMSIKRFSFENRCSWLEEHNTGLAKLCGSREVLSLGTQQRAAAEMPHGCTTSWDPGVEQGKWTATVVDI